MPLSILFFLVLSCEMAFLKVNLTLLFNLSLALTYPPFTELTQQLRPFINTREHNEPRFVAYIRCKLDHLYEHSLI